MRLKVVVVVGVWGEVMVERVQARRRISFNGQW